MAHANVNIDVPSADVDAYVQRLGREARAAARLMVDAGTHEKNLALTETAERIVARPWQSRRR